MRARRYLTLILTALAFSAAATWAASGLWLDVPYIHQQKDGCGSASAAMVLRYWQGKGFSVPGDRADPEKIQRQLYAAESRGIHARAMEHYLRDTGFDVFTFRGEWRDLASNVSKGRPLIVALKTGSASLHYVVVVGFAPEDAAVLLNDPERGKLISENRARFEKAWLATENLTILAVPRARL